MEETALSYKDMRKKRKRAPKKPAAGGSAIQAAEGLLAQNVAVATNVAPAAAGEVTQNI